jgi:hypothetical protein
MAKITMKARNEVINKHMGAYLGARKKGRSEILDIVCEATGLTRDHAASILRKGRERPVKERKHQHKVHRKKDGRGRKKLYGEEIVEPLIFIWEQLDYCCSVRLKEGIPDAIASLQRFNEIDLTEEIIEKLSVISASTIDRLLKEKKRSCVGKGMSTTKPGTLKKEILVRVGTDWDEKKPGFVEMDLVAHCGRTTSGEYVNTLDVIDIDSGWNETRAVINKAQGHVFEAIKQIRSSLPFPLRGIDSDNGVEFINHQLKRYCDEEEITFTRSRAMNKNDGCHVEEKNYSRIRRRIGYDRFEGSKPVALLNLYYENLRLLSNFFLPSMKLKKVIHKANGRTQKTYETSMSPYKRLINGNHISEKKKKELTKIQEQINLKKINDDMMKISEELDKIAIPQWKSDEIMKGGN